MATGKKYYWLKLDRNFFKRHDIRIIEEQTNGKDYILFYLKLLVESIDHEGQLRFSDTIPYDEKMLSVVTNTNIDIVRSAIKIFTELGLMEICDDKTIYMTETQKMLGESTSTHRVQAFRERQKTLQIETQGNVNETLHETEIEIEKELEKDIEKEKDIALSNDNVSVEPDEPLAKNGKIDFKAIAEWWNAHSKLKEITKITDQRKPNINARVKEHGIEAIYKMIDQAGRSSFLRGDNSRGFIATFDWCFKPKNFVKVLEGNYIDDKANRTIYDDVAERVRKMNEYMGVKS
jgi:predicted phage replisome organizer